MKKYRLLRFGTDRSGVTALIFALAAMMLLLAIALAVDFGGIIAAKARLDIAADAAALTSATVASQMYVASGSLTAAQTTAAQNAGVNRFRAVFGSMANVSSPTPGLPVVTPPTSGNNVYTASETYSATYIPYFGGVLGWNSVTISNTSTVSVALSAPYLNIEILLDNSGSMEIAAEPADIQVMQELTVCAVTGAYYCTSTSTTNSCSKGTYSSSTNSCSQNGTLTTTTSCAGWGQSSSLPTANMFYTKSSSSQSYNAYSCGGSGYSYTDSTGINTCPIPSMTMAGSPFSLANGTYPAFPVTGGNPGPACQWLLPAPSGETANPTYNGFPVSAGPPCAFACHFDTSASPNDFFTLARSTIGTSYSVNLRFDYIKNAVNNVLSDMSTYDLSNNNLHVGIFWFADKVVRVYPTSACATSGESLSGANWLNEACDGWGTAKTAVGQAPTALNPVDNGIMPYVGANGGETDFSGSMSTLATTYLTTKAGNGATIKTPRKALIIVTDGLNDPSSRAMTAFDPSNCATFKNNGYSIFVLYTPYYSLMNPYYFNGTNPSVASIAQAASTATNSIPYNLQQCASSPDNYIEAKSKDAINAAMEKFLQQAMATPARITQ